jgi:membrane protein insertase Oxa1/YidC/SpoIIIJ
MTALNSGDGGNSAKILEKINNMISSNMLILGVFFLLLVALCLALYYFVSSLMFTISNHNISKVTLKSQLTSKGESVKDTTADNETYPEPVNPNDAEAEFDLTPQVDPKKFMPRGKREFISLLTAENEDYNKKKTEILVNEFNYAENDDIVDEKVLYADYDDYKYKYGKEDD